MKRFFISYLICGLIMALLLLFWADRSLLKSALVAAVIMFVNVAVLGWAWNHLLNKKRIALPAGVIVFKYPSLGFIIYLLLSHQWVNSVGFCMGFALILPAALIWAVLAESDKAVRTALIQEKREAF